MLVNVDPLIAAPPSALRRMLVRRFRIALVAGPGSPPVTDHPDAAADAVIGVMTEVLEAKDEEIDRLQKAVETGQPVQA